MYKTEFTKKMEQEFGEFDQIPKFFRPVLNENPTEQEIYLYLKQHLRYDTMRNWNQVTSYANNVKIYNLDFDNKQKEKYFHIHSDNFDVDDLDYYNDSIQEILELFSKHYNYNYKLNFNGSQGGYLVIYHSEKINDKYNIYPGKSIGNKYADYTSDEFKEYFELVYDFDTICDILRYTVDKILSMEIEEYVVPQPAIKNQRFKKV